MKSRAPGLALLYALTLAVPHASADVEAGLEAARRGDFPAALAKFRPLAEAGDPRAQALLANMYRRGFGVPVDDGQAFLWYRRAAEQGDAVAQYNLAICYRDGVGTERDEGAAMDWYERAARQDFGPAQINLGLRYFTGDGVAENRVRGFAWLERAANAGNQLAARQRDQLAEQMDPDELEAARKLARTIGLTD